MTNFLRSWILNKIHKNEPSKHFVQILRVSEDESHFYISDKFHFVKAKFKDEASKKLFYEKEIHQKFKPFNLIRGSIVKLRKFTIEEPTTEKGEYIFVISEIEFMGNKGNDQIGNPKSVEKELQKLQKPSKLISSKQVVIQECIIPQEQKNILDELSSLEISEELETPNSFEVLTPEIPLKVTNPIIPVNSIKPYQDFSTSTFSYEFPVDSASESNPNRRNSDFFMSNLYEDYDLDTQDPFIKDIKITYENSFFEKEIDPETQELERNYWKKKEKINDEDMLDMIADNPIDFKKTEDINISPILEINDDSFNETIIGTPEHQEEDLISTQSQDLGEMISSQEEISPPIIFNSKTTFNQHNISISVEEEEDNYIDELLDDSENDVILLSNDEWKNKNQKKKMLIIPDSEDIEEYIPDHELIPKKRKISNQTSKLVIVDGPITIELMTKSQTQKGKFDNIFFPHKASIARYGVVWDYAVIYAPILNIKSTAGSLDFCQIGERTFKSANTTSCLTYFCSKTEKPKFIENEKKHWEMLTFCTLCSKSNSILDLNYLYDNKKNCPWIDTKEICAHGLNSTQDICVPFITSRSGKNPAPMYYYFEEKTFYSQKDFTTIILTPFTDLIVPFALIIIFILYVIFTILFIILPQYLSSCINWEKNRNFLYNISNFISLRILSIFWVLTSNMIGIVTYSIYGILVIDDDRNKFILVIGWITMLLLDLFAFATLTVLWRHILNQSDELSLTKQPLPLKMKLTLTLVYFLLIIISTVTAALRILITYVRNEIIYRTYGVAVGLFGISLFVLCIIFIILTAQLYIRYVKFQTTSLDFMKLRFTRNMFFSEIFGIFLTFYFIYVTIIQFGGLDVLSYFMAISSDLFIMLWRRTYNNDLVMSDDSTLNNEVQTTDSPKPKIGKELKWNEFGNEFYLSAHKNQFPSLNGTKKKNEEILQDKDVPGFVQKSIAIFSQDWKVVHRNPSLYKPQPLKPEFTYQSLAPTEKDEEEDQLSFISETKSDDESEDTTSASIDFPKERERRGSSTSSGNVTPKSKKQGGWLGIKFKLGVGGNKSSANLAASFRQPEDEKKKNQERPSYPLLFENNKTAKVLEVSKSIEKILPADSEFDEKKVEVQNNLLSLSRPNFKWSKTEEVLCDRYPSQPYPLGKVCQFLVSPKSFQFEFTLNELLFCTMALYDIGKGIKVSEDFHYFINPSEEPIPGNIAEDIENSDSNCLFSVIEPTISTYLVISVERILLGSYNDGIMPYTKKLSQADKLKIKNAYAKQNDLAKCRQTLMWGYAKLFYPRDGVKGEDYPDPFAVPGKLITGPIEISPMYKMPQESKRIDYLDLMMFRKGISSEELDKKYGIEGCFTYNIDLMYDSNIEDVKQSNGTTKLDPFRFITTEKLNTSYNSVFEFPDQDAKLPFLTFFNNLYIYPQAFCASIKDKKPSIAILMEFKSDDDSLSVPSEKYFTKRYLPKEKTDYSISSVSYGTKNPFFYEEIKVDLPLVLNQKQHILFTFYNIMVDDIKPGTISSSQENLKCPIGLMKKEIIGYSFLPISDNGYLIADSIKTLEVHKTLKKNYLSVKKKNADLTKSTFEVQFKVNSSVFPKDFAIKNFYCYTHFIEKHKPYSKEMDSFLNGLSRSLEQMNRSNYENVLHCLPQLLNESIFSLLTVSSKTKDLKLIDVIHQTGFVALLAITKDIAKDSPIGKRNKDLSTFVEYHMDEFPTQKPMYIFMLELMSKYLEMEEEKLNDTIDQKKTLKEITDQPETVVDATDLLTYSYFFFEIILKSVAIANKKSHPSLYSEGQSSGWIKDLILSNQFEDELKKFTFLFCVQMCNHCDPQVGKAANRQLALFIRSLIPILQSSQIPAIIGNYIDCLDMYSGSFLNFKVEFFHILFDSDNILPLLSTSAKSIIDRYVPTLLSCIELETNSSLRDKALFYFVEHLTKLDFDSRLQESKNFISDAYWPIITNILKKEETLEFCFINEGLEFFLISIIWLLSNKQNEKLIKWYQSLPMNQVINLFKLLNATVVMFSYQPPMNSTSSNQQQQSEESFQSPHQKKPDLKKLEESQRRATETVFSINSLIDLLFKNSKEMFEEFKKEQSLFDIMSAISELFMNLLLNKGQNKELLTVLTNQKDGLSRFDTFVKLSNFLDLFISELIVTEEDVKDIKVGKILALQKLESNWRKLVGATLANVTHPIEKTHKIISKCLSLLLEPYYSAVNLQVKSIDTNETDELFDKDVIKAGSVEKLIKYIFEKKERNYEKMFLLTYFSFTKPKDLLITLICLYHENFKNEDPDRIRLLSFLSDWVKNGYHNFDNTVIAILIKFLDDDLLTTKYNTTQNKMKKYIINKLVDCLEEKQQAAKEQKLPEVPKGFDIVSMAKPKIPFKQFQRFKKLKDYSNPFDYNFNILEWSSQELAIQLTLIEMDLFKKIEPKECFGLAWSKSNKLDLAPHIVAISERFNKVSDWIQSVILTEPDVKLRQGILQKFMEIAKICRSENCYNFTTINQITSALNSAAVHRLKKTFEILSKDDIKTFENLSNLFSKPPYNELRQALKGTAGYPTVPFIGVYLTELTFIEEGNPNFTEVGDKKLVNFFKRRLFSETLLNISLYQQNVYQYQELPYLKYILTEEIFEKEVFDDKQSFAQSLVIEPRKK
eukprot:gene9724-1928_t